MAEYKGMRPEGHPVNQDVTIHLRLRPGALEQARAAPAPAAGQRDRTEIPSIPADDPIFSNGFLITTPVRRKPTVELGGESDTEPGAPPSTPDAA